MIWKIHNNPNSKGQYKIKVTRLEIAIMCVKRLEKAHKMCHCLTPSKPKISYEPKIFVYFLTILKKSVLEGKYKISTCVLCSSMSCETDVKSENPCCLTSRSAFGSLGITG